MIVVRLRGGLGNQMFQYAAGRALAERNRDDLALDFTLLLDHTSSSDVPRGYDLDIFERVRARPTLLSRFVLRCAAAAPLARKASQFIARSKSLVRAQQNVRETSLRFDPLILHLAGNVYLDGYWQSERYFADVAPVIRRDFSFEPIADPRVAEMAAVIEQSNAVCLNVRRGDFVDHAASARTHGFVGKEYYVAGMARVLQQLDGPHVFVFSDDMDWCRSNLDIAAPHTFVEHDVKGPKFRDYLRLMTLCKHFLIPNSTFAWWAAWLSAHADKLVIAPQRWFADPALDASDIYLPTWVRL